MTLLILVLTEIFTHGEKLILGCQVFLRKYINECISGVFQKTRVSSQFFFISSSTVNKRIEKNIPFKHKILSSDFGG